MIEIRITLDNGQDVWLAMPSSPAEMAEAYTAYGNAVNEGKQIRDAKSPVGNLSGHLRGLTVTSRALGELAFLNQRIEGMTEQEREIFGAMLETPKPYSVMEMVNLSCNMDKFVHYPEITDEALLGEYVLKKNYSQTPQELVALLDYESVGRNYARRHAGVFSENGYTVRTGQALEPLYDGQHLPDPAYEKNSLFVLKIYGKEHSPSLYLPAPESKISAMEKNLGVSSLDDCSGLSIQENVQGLKNRLPCGISVRELNRFVRELQQTLDGTKEQLDKLFMALEAEAPASADEAVRIARELEQYQVVLSPKEYQMPSDYAYKVLEDSGTYYVDDFTANYVDYEALGRAMMREDGAVMTSFGIAVRNDHTIRLRPKERTTLRLFSPLAASQEERGDWGEATGRMRELEGDELCSYGTEIMEAIEKENQYLNQERGLAEYIDNLILSQKVYSMKPTVDAWDERLWGVLEVQTYGALSEGEMKELMSEWSGQESDGWGEGFEQREIKTADGDLYVSFWQSGDNFFIKTEQELKGGQTKMQVTIAANEYKEKRGYEGAAVELPASRFELDDALQRAHVPENGAYKLQRFIQWPGFLSGYLASSGDKTLEEVNLLAQKISRMDEIQLETYEGALQLRRDENIDMPVSMKELINYTYNLDAFEFHPGVVEDGDLGKIAMMGGMFDIVDDLTEEVAELLDAGKVGEALRRSDQGAFTRRGFYKPPRPENTVRQSRSGTEPATHENSFGKNGWLDVPKCQCKGWFAGGLAENNENRRKP